MLEIVREDEEDGTERLLRHNSSRNSQAQRVEIARETKEIPRRHRRKADRGQRKSTGATES